MKTHLSKTDWKPYFIARRKAIAFFLSLIPVILIIDSLYKVISNRLLAWIAVTICYFSYGIIVGGKYMSRFLYFPCPNCQRTIHFNGFVSFPFSPNCLHCKVRIGATGSEEKV